MYVGMRVWVGSLDDCINLPYPDPPLSQPRQDTGILLCCRAQQSSPTFPERSLMQKGGGTGPSLFLPKAETRELLVAPKGVL